MQPFDIKRVYNLIILPSVPRVHREGSERGGGVEGEESTDDPGSKVAGDGRAFASNSRGSSRNREMFNIPSWSGGYKEASGLQHARQELAKGRKEEQRVRWREEGRETPKGRKDGPRERGGQERGREDIPESYGPSTSRSNILANLCPIKINQTPSRSAVSGPA